MSSRNFKITVEWDWKTWGIGVGVSSNDTRPYIFGLELGPFALMVK